MLIELLATAAGVMTQLQAQLGLQQKRRIACPAHRKRCVVYVSADWDAGTCRGG